MLIVLDKIRNIKHSRGIKTKFTMFGTIVNQVEMFGSVADLEEADIIGKVEIA